MKKIFLMLIILVNAKAIFAVENLPSGYAVELSSNEYKPIAEIKGDYSTLGKFFPFYRFSLSKEYLENLRKKLDKSSLDDINRFFGGYLYSDKPISEVVQIFEGEKIKCSDLKAIINLLKIDPDFAGGFTNPDEMYKIISEKSCGKKIKWFN